MKSTILIVWRISTSLVKDHNEEYKPERSPKNCTQNTLLLVFGLRLDDNRPIERDIHIPSRIINVYNELLGVLPRCMHTPSVKRNMSASKASNAPYAAATTVTSGCLCAYDHEGPI